MGKFLEYLIETRLKENSAIAKQGSGWPLISEQEIDSFKNKDFYAYAAMKWFLGKEYGDSSEEAKVAQFQLPPENISKKIPIRKAKDSSSLPDVIEMIVRAEIVKGDQQRARAKLMENIVKQFSQGPEELSINGKKLYFYYGDLSNVPSGMKQKIDQTALDEYDLYTDDVIGPGTTISSSSKNVGIYTKEKDGKLHLKAIVRYRIAKAAKSDAKKQTSDAVIPNASILLGKVFGGGPQELKATKESTKKFADKTLEVVNKQIGDVESMEYKTYAEMFEKMNFNEPNTSKKNKSFSSFAFSPEVAKYIKKSNVGKTIAEIFVPWLLANNVNEFANQKNIIEAVTDENYTIEKISWPEGATNPFSDYDLFFAEAVSPTGVRKLFPISAKYKEGHRIPLLPLLLKSIPMLEKLKPNQKISTAYKKSRIKKIADVLKKYGRYKSSETGGKDIVEGKLNGQMMFATWIAGAVSIGMTESAISQLFDLWMKLQDKTANVSDIKKSPLYKALYQKISSTDKSLINNRFPYSLTAALEKLAQRWLDEDKASKDVVKFMLKEIGNDYSQIRLLPDAKYGFTIDIKRPKDESTKIEIGFRAPDGQKHFGDIDVDNASEADKQALIKAVLRTQQGQALVIGIE